MGKALRHHADGRPAISLIHEGTESATVPGIAGGLREKIHPSPGQEKPGIPDQATTSERG